MFGRLVVAFSIFAYPAFSFLTDENFDTCVKSYQSASANNIFLSHTGSILDSDEGKRIHTFSVIKKSLTSSSSSQTVGVVKLVDFQEEDSVLGNYALDLIQIGSDHQGQGLGSLALKEVITLSQFLATADQDYTFLQLQCADETATGEKLGEVPYRLKYYLNAGFQLDQRTVNYMKHLDLNHFIQRMTPSLFKDYVEYYLSEDKSVVAKFYSRQILSELKKESKLSGLLSDEEVLQIAESSSSKAAQRILDRLYYDSTITDSEQGLSGGLMYLMRLNVLEWEAAKIKRQETLSLRENVRRIDINEDETFQSLIISIILRKISSKQTSTKRKSGKENRPLRAKRARYKSKVTTSSL